jgi:hypothetical protein
MPAMRASLDYARAARLPYEAITSSTALTPIVWGIFSSRAAVESGTPLDWELAQGIAAAERWDALPGGRADWGFVKFAFSAPDNAIGGVGVLLSAAGAYASNPAITAQSVNDTAFRDWLTPVLASVPNYNTLGQDPAAALTRGPSVGEIALLPESQWLTNLNGIRGREDIFLSYPRYAFVLDFPLALWSDATTPPAERAAVEQFAAWLLQPEQQNDALRLGLRPASGIVDATATLFNAGVEYGIQLAPDLSQRITPPDRDSILRLLAWAANSR